MFPNRQRHPECSARHERHHPAQGTALLQLVRIGQKLCPLQFYNGSIWSSWAPQNIPAIYTSTHKLGFKTVTNRLYCQAAYRETRTSWLYRSLTNRMSWILACADAGLFLNFIQRLGHWGCRGWSACATKTNRLRKQFKNTLQCWTVWKSNVAILFYYSSLWACLRSSPGMKHWRGRSTALFLRHPGTRLAWGQEIEGLAGRVDVRNHKNTWDGAIFQPPSSKRLFYVKVWGGNMWKC